MSVVICEANEFLTFDQGGKDKKYLGLLGLSKDPRIDEVLIQRARNTSSSYRWVSAILSKGRAVESRLNSAYLSKLGHYRKTRRIVRVIPVAKSARDEDDPSALALRRSGFRPQPQVFRRRPPPIPTSRPLLTTDPRQSPLCNTKKIRVVGPAAFLRRGQCKFWRARRRDRLSFPNKDPF